MIVVVRQRGALRPVEVLRRKASLFLPKNTAHPSAAEVPHVELVRDEAPRRGWFGNVGDQVRGEFRAVGGKVFTDDELVGCKRERRIT